MGNLTSSALYILIQNTPTEDVTALGERIERPDTHGDFDALINDAMAAGVPGLRVEKSTDHGIAADALYVRTLAATVRLKLL
ncbi:hypothetical protein GOD83_24545 [Sinorhizobium medicae]|nr:hypothetical protein [Sinorhizobium medicae]MDX0579814.1 hypothetical protein [Sinorhizobium medicae]MDX0783448.1 hypothetical protein [Sinorhizobium medicae]